MMTYFDILTYFVQPKNKTLLHFPTTITTTTTTTTTLLPSDSIRKNILRLFLFVYFHTAVQ